MIPGLLAVLEWMDLGLLTTQKVLELGRLVNDRGADLTDAELAELGVKRDWTHADIEAAAKRAKERHTGA